MALVSITHSQTLPSLGYPNSRGTNSVDWMTCQHSVKYTQFSKSWRVDGRKYMTVMWDFKNYVLYRLRGTLRFLTFEFFLQSWLCLYALYVYKNEKNFFADSSTVSNFIHSFIYSFIIYFIGATTRWVTRRLGHQIDIFSKDGRLTMCSSG